MKIAKYYKSAASLHSHTHHSKEALTFIPQFTEKYPVLRWALERQCKKAAIPVNFDRAYWTPPLSAEMSLQVEKNQIEGLGLRSLVSLTDHDTIDGPLHLRALPDTKQTPISLEWSLPYSGTVFHIGVHNLPADLAQEIAADLATYTQAPSDERATELLAGLDALPDVLIVFNHPLWDQSESGKARHEGAMELFMKANGRFVHAIEINATRGWRENERVRGLADGWNLPCVSGGDRHGCDPSSALNLTNAETFPELVHEIRRERRSHVLMMPQYAEPRCMRITQMLLDVIREYPGHPIGTRRWDNRVFHPGRSNEGDRPVSSLWKAPPAFVEVVFSVLRLLEHSAVKNALAQAMPREDVTSVATDLASDVSYEATL